MLKSLDRYVLKEIFAPFGIGLVIYTLTLLINMIFILSSTLISSGASTFTIIKILLYLLPDLLSFTIPMSTLMGILAGMSRMSSDSEIVALRTMGVNNFRLFKPVMVFSLITWFISSILIMYLAPEGNYQYQKLKTKIFLSRAMSSVKPRTFNLEFPTYILYFNDIDKNNGDWKKVFLYSRHDGINDNVILADSGRLIQGQGNKKSYFLLKDVVIHSYNKREPGKKYTTTYYRSTSEEIPSFISFKQARRSQQLIFPDLVKKLKENPENIRLWREFHRKFSLPFACIALGFLALSLGITTKKGGKVSGFIISLGIIFIYYTTITTFQNLILKKLISPFIGMWAPNFFLLVTGIIFYYFSSTEKLINWERYFNPANRFKALFRKKVKKPLFTFKIRLSGKRMIKTLDLYVLKKLILMFIFIFISLLMVFYIVRIVELIDNIIENNIPFIYVLKYVYYNTPEMISFVLPVSMLTSVLLTFSIMSKNNEITAVRVSGISLYRISLPAILLGIFLSLFYFFIQENITPEANRKSTEILNKIYKRGSNFNIHAIKNWIIGKDNRIYFFDYLETKKKHYKNFNVIKLGKNFTMKQRISAKTAFWEDNDILVLKRGFIRDFSDNSPNDFIRFKNKSLKIPEGKGYFSKKILFPEFMNIKHLNKYIKYLKDNNSSTERFMSKLYYKYSFPFSTLIMVLIAIPFSFKMGNRGTLFGIGIAVGISIIFWGTFGIFSALGSSSLMSPFLSAFAPLLIFATISGYLFMNIKT